MRPRSKTRKGISRPLCPSCGEFGSLVTASAYFAARGNRDGSKLSKWVWVCEPCDTAVFCHGRSQHPTGTMAPPETRRLRYRAHLAFDPIWLGRAGLLQEQGFMNGARLAREEAYHWLADKLGISRGECHIALFGQRRCERVIQICKGEVT